MNGRKPNRQEKEWLNKVTELGCCVCRKHYGIFSPAEPHHINGCRKEGAHYHTIGLCPRHHRLSCPTGSLATRHGPGSAAGRFAFENEYGTEQKLLDYVVELLNADND